MVWGSRVGHRGHGGAVSGGLPGGVSEERRGEERSRAAAHTADVVQLRCGSITSVGL